MKGKGNRAPTGKYAPYIRDFLNELGITASGTAISDLRGIGLLTHQGKYGTIFDIGGDLITTFSNGDSIRALEEPKVSTNFGAGGRQFTTITLAYYYVEKNGTTPFEMNFAPSSEEKGLRLTGVKFSAKKSRGIRSMPKI